MKRVPSAHVLPLHRPRKRVLPGVGPGHYLRRHNFFDADDTAVRRQRADDGVVSWVRPPGTLGEHARALYSERPVDRAVRGDPRAMLSLDFDRAVRPRGRAATIDPEPEPRRRSWAAGEDEWCFYEPEPWPEPKGLGSFSRRVAFEDFPEHDALWAALERRTRRRNQPSAALAYDIPDAEITGERAPRYDFGLPQGRPEGGSPGGDGSPKEGDVLLLSPAWLSRLPRAPALVDMARQLDRGLEEAAADGDDFDELFLSPRPVQRRSPSLVDMGRVSARPEDPSFSAHVFRTRNAGVPDLCFHPLASAATRDPAADELLLAASPADALRSRPAYGDFALALGREGVDERVPIASSSHECSALLTNWSPPPAPSRRPTLGLCPPGSPAGRRQPQVTSPNETPVPTLSAPNSRSGGSSSSSPAHSSEDGLGGRETRNGSLNAGGAGKLLKLADLGGSALREAAVPPSPAENPSPHGSPGTCSSGASPGGSSPHSSPLSDGSHASSLSDGT